MLHTALICTFMALSPSATSPHVEHADIRQDTETLDSPVVLAQTRRRRRRTSTPKRSTRPPVANQDKSPFLVYFWKFFAPPGNYSMEIGASGGIQFLETAYGDTNPNSIYRLHGAFRPAPGSIPLQLMASLDYTRYGQEAGKLSVTSQTLGLGFGGGLVGWVGPVKFDLNAEVGPLFRMGSINDDAESFSNFAIAPAATATGGMAISLFGHVALTARGQARVTTPSHVHYSILYGLEWMIDAKPVTVY